ncbi:MAG: hypothetical protein IGS03_08980 [Candidatus Sericytochromatia bacterium]|nr:hypothetical protein [Candidatus Sericytochromatia bacterium]
MALKPLGKNLETDALTAALEHCMLTDEEMALGPEQWPQLTGGLHV